ncbi:MAG: DUF3450 domain-containing protein [Saccharofermentans sp.]|nr:DUF3450 domain-containing protein [Saccharofermentans sp.]
MGNLGAREKYGFMLLGVVVLVFLIYFFGIRSAQASYDSLVAQRNELSARLQYYEQLKNQNASAETAINALNQDISSIEATFLPALNAESLEQYVLSVFEENGCPYLVNVSLEAVGADSVTLPDGSPARDSILINRISVQYSSTDGYNIPQYNQSDSVNNNGDLDEELLNTLLDGMVWHGTSGIKGYDEFIASLAAIESENPDCVKVHSVHVEDEAGYLLMSAEIDFYSVTFTNRVSTPNLSAPYVTFAGAPVDTDGGFIGMPFIVDNQNSAWYNVSLTDADALAGTRPFATYYSNVIFTDAVASQGLLGVLDVGDAPAPEVVE